MGHSPLTPLARRAPGRTPALWALGEERALPKLEMRLLKDLLAIPTNFSLLRSSSVSQGEWSVLPTRSHWLVTISPRPQTEKLDVGKFPPSFLSAPFPF